MIKTKYYFLLLIVLLTSCEKYPFYQLNTSRCSGISTEQYHHSWKYFEIKHPGQNWQPHPSNSIITLNDTDTVTLSFYPNYCLSNDLSCGYFELDINPGVTFSSYIDEDTLYLHNDINGISWKLMKQ